ncbi:MAG: PAS domain S-box protein, partial [Solirubrobacteraceae bacterium]|nr:PAS domain S-box protein [Solirubrobacteraceae bacterium]
SAQADVLQLVRVAAGGHRLHLDAARQLLNGLELLPSVHEARAADMAPILARLRAEYPGYLQIAMAGPDGLLLAAADPALARADVADEAWFGQALRGRDFVVGEYHAPGRLGAVPSLVCAHPVRRADGSLAGVLWAALRLDWVEDLGQEVSRLPGGAFAVLDASGAVLSHHPQPEWAVGRVFQDPALARAMRASGEGVTRLTGPDGVRRVFAFAPLGGEREAWLAVGFSEDAAFAPTRDAFAKSVAVLLALTLALLLAAWRGAQTLIFEPAQRLSQAARRIGVGDLAARVGDMPHDDEFSRLGRAFDQMAERLERHFEEHERDEAALRDSEARKTAIVESAPDAIILTDARANILEFNATAERMFGYPREQALGCNLIELVAPPDLRPALHLGLDRYVRTGESAVVGRLQESRGRRADGAELPVEYVFTPVRQSQGGLLFSVVVRDISERLEHEQALRALALVDDLTGLYNRRGMLTLGQQQLREADRGLRRLALIYTDLEVRHRRAHRRRRVRGAGARELARRPRAPRAAAARAGGGVQPPVGAAVGAVAVDRPGALRPLAPVLDRGAAGARRRVDVRAEARQARGRRGVAGWGRPGGDRPAAGAPRARRPRRSRHPRGVEAPRGAC